MYARKRESLIQALGGKCVRCGSREGLEFDHVRGRKWDIVQTASHQRMKRYVEEAGKGLLQLLCKTHNVQKGNRVHV
jgi:hypothetical protein